MEKKCSKFKRIKINEIFSSIQGEGRFVGQPALFVRVSGCTRTCPWCDTQYHREGKWVTTQKLKQQILDWTCPPYVVVITGGEPLLFKAELTPLIKYLKKRTKYTLNFHLETNGDLIRTSSQLLALLNTFDYVCISPKSIEVAKRLKLYRDRLLPVIRESHLDIKVVTDLEKVGVDLIEYATMLMPLTTSSPRKDLVIKRRVWKFCTYSNLLYSPRIHVDVWRGKRGT